MGGPDRLHILHAMTTAMAEARAAEDVTHHALAALVAGLGERVRASVLFFDEQGVMRFRAWRGLSDAYRRAVEGHSPWRPGDRGAEPIVLASIEDDPGLTPYREVMATEDIVSMAMIPLIAGGGVIGKFMLYARERAAFGPADVALAAAIGAVTAFAFDRLRAIEDLQTERSLFMGGPTVVFKWRNAPGWPVEYVSPNVRAQLGWTTEQLVGGEVAYASLVHPDDLPRIGREVAAAVEAGQRFFEQSYRLRRADGQYRTLYDFTVVARSGAGEVTHFHGYLVDVSEREVAEAALRQAERRLLEVQRLESLGLLAGGIAHDFNNLLVGILGHTSLARQGVERAAALAAIDAIETAARRAAELTRQLLAYSGRGRFVVEPVDVSELVRESTDLLGTAVSRTATIVLELASELPAVEADATQIRQVVMNLLTNASEALEDRPGTIRVRTRAEQVTEQDPELEPGSYVVIEVVDDGIGMDEATRKQVFDPFFTTKFHGHGLGMAAALGIAKGHRGAIRIASEVARGTTCALLLPASDRRPASRAPSPAPSVVAPGVKVLVVDDAPTVRALTARLLEGEGFEVHAAENGAAALQKLASVPDVRVVLLDLTMPIMSGGAALEQIRRRWPTVRVILSSGYDGEVTGAAAKADAFIQKPYLAEDLLALVHREAARPR